MTMDRAAWEERLGEALADTLGVEAVPTDVRFAELGLTSLGGLRFLDSIRDRIGVELALVDLFEHPTLAALARACEPRRAGAPPAIAPAPAAPSHPLSPLQLSLYLLHGRAAAGDSPSLPLVIEGRGAPPAAAKMHAAFEQVVERHEPLRTAFREIDGMPRQIVLPASQAAHEFGFADLTRHPRPLAALAEQYRDVAGRPFALAEGGTARLRLAHLPEERWALLISAHHIVSDSFTPDRIARDLAAFVEGRPPAPLPFQYKDYVYWLDAWCAGPEGLAAADFWRGALARMLPAEPARGDLATAWRERRLELGPPAGASLAAHLLAAMATALRRWDGRDDRTIGLAVSTRDVALAGETIGPFVNTLPIRVATPADRAAIEVDLARALAHKQLPVERIAEAAGLAGPLFDVGLSIEERAPPGELEAALRARSAASEATVVPILFLFAHDGSSAMLRLRYRTDSHSSDDIDQLLTLVSETLDKDTKMTA
ncbi:MAG TPA: condensation domain-containing protein [Allosphingosinicella sp.]|nr:condensation domain-containing protein [Allosphingosinicella sp.]